MWVRKRIDIDVSEMFVGIGQVAFGKSIDAALQDIELEWQGPDHTFVALSVRSGLDLMLTALEWSPGDEILMSGVTIKDMPLIIRQHGLVPVPIDIDLVDQTLDLKQLEQSITPRTKAILIAHLFGSRIDLTPIVAIAQRHNLLLIEDCAQAYIGKRYTGDERVDVSMFSFGPIKTHTSLSGAVFTIRDSVLKTRLDDLHRAWPRLSSFSTLKRYFKYLFVKFLSRRWIATPVATALRWMGKDHDQMATHMARGFAGGDFFKKIRHQPSVALLRLLARRLEQDCAEVVAKRKRKGDLIEKLLGPEFPILGSKALLPTHWVIPVLAENTEKIPPQMWRDGFDSTVGSSLFVIDSAGWQPDVACPVAAEQLKHLIFLPFSYKMPDEAIEKMAASFLKYARPISKSERNSHLNPPHIQTDSQWVAKDESATLSEIS